MTPAQHAQTTRYRVWQAIRVLRRFKTPEVIALGGMRPKSVRNYVAFLKRVGILRSLSDGYTMLVRDLGPLAPIERKDGRSFQDPNEHAPSIAAHRARLLNAQRLGCINCTRSACGDCPKAKAEEERHG